MAALAARRRTARLRRAEEPALRSSEPPREEVRPIVCRAAAPEQRKSGKYLPTIPGGAWGDPSCARPALEAGVEAVELGGGRLCPDFHDTRRRRAASRPRNQLAHRLRLALEQR